jgi:membrane-associated phospholipid phosphatase
MRIRSRAVAAFILAAALSAPVRGAVEDRAAVGDEGTGRAGLSAAKALSNVKTTLLSPFHWKNKDFVTLSAVLGAGLVLGLLDEGIRDRVQENRTVRSNDFFDVVTRFGDGGYLCGFMAGLFAVGAVSRSDGLKTTAVLGLESFLVSSVFADVFKAIPGRARPYTEEGSHSFKPFSFKSSHSSMPSGHSSGIWSVATVIADRTDNVAVDVVCYGVAALTSFSRIHQDKHWASDVLIGSAIGYFTAKKICALNRMPDGPKLSASFNLAGRGRAVTLSLAF